MTWPRRLLLGSVVVVAVLMIGASWWSFGGSKPRSYPAFKAKCSALDYRLPQFGTLAWSDEFDGSQVDASKWNVRDQQSLSFDSARILAANVSQAQGMLDIRAERATVGGRRFSTGYLDTLGLYSRQYGRWEIRAKLPTTPGSSRGLWPAFWLRADHRPGEIDVMEAWGSPDAQSQDRPDEYAWTIHKDTSGRTGKERLTGWAATPDRRVLSAEFHVFAVDWSPSCLRFSLDGRTVGSVHTVRTGWLADSLSGPVNMRLNLQVGSRSHGYPSNTGATATKLPASLLVDYVRVFRPAARH